MLVLCVAGLNAQVDGAQDGERRGVVTECGAVLQHPPSRRQAVQAPASPLLQPQQQGERGGQYTYGRFCRYLRQSGVKRGQHKEQVGKLSAEYDVIMNKGQQTTSRVKCWTEEVPGQVMIESESLGKVKVNYLTKRRTTQSPLPHKLWKVDDETCEHR